MLRLSGEGKVVRTDTGMDNKVLLVLRSTSPSSKKICQPLTVWNSVKVNDIMKSDNDLMILPPYI